MEFTNADCYNNSESSPQEITMSEKIGYNRALPGPRVNIVLIGFGLIGVFLLIAEHRAHVLPYLPWLFLAACLFMHQSMHGGHAHGNDDGNSGDAMRANPALPAVAPIQVSATEKAEVGNPLARFDTLGRETAAPRVDHFTTNKDVSHES